MITRGDDMDVHSHDGNSEASTSDVTITADDNDEVVKASQRPITSCSFCYKRKIKCSKVFPCLNCIKRNKQDSCVQATVVVRGTKVGGKAAPTPLTEEQLRVENEALHKKVRSQQRLIATLSRNADPALLDDEDLVKRPRVKRSAAALPAVPEVASHVKLRDSMLDVRFKTWGMESTGDSLSPQTAGLNWDSSRWYDDERWAGRSLLDMVPDHCSTFLVKASAKFTGWIHCSVHWPTFVAEHEGWLESLKRMREGQAEIRYDWLALYFSIISGALFYLDTMVGDLAGFTPEELQRLPKDWFECSAEALKRSNFLAAPTFEALQTICVLPMVAHNFGASIYCQSLLQCGIGLAQRLNLHRLSADTAPIPGMGRIKLELGRRIWVCLMVGESMTPTAQQPNAIFYSRSIIAPPSNVNDENLSDLYPVAPLPLSQPTVVTHLLAMRAIADIYRTYNKSFHRATSLEEQYRICLDADKAFSAVFDFCPSLAWDGVARRLNVDLDSPFNFLDWARVDLASVVPIARIMVYSSLYARSFTDNRFEIIRQICLESARHYLTEKVLDPPPLVTKSWHVWANTVMSGMVLATELIHGEDSVENKILLRGEVLVTITRIKAGDAISAVANRGATLLQKMVDSVNIPTLPAPEDFLTLPDDMSSDYLWPWPSIEVDATGNLVWNSTEAWDNVMGELQLSGLETYEQV